LIELIELLDPEFLYRKDFDVDIEDNDNDEEQEDEEE